MDDDSLMRMAEAEKFLYFTKGEYPCIFMIHVKEGFARFEVKDDKAFMVLIDYCQKKNLQVEWVQAVLNDEFHTKEYAHFPGGKYIAHHLGDEVLDGVEVSAED